MFLNNKLLSEIQKYDPTIISIPKDSNYVEGGINSQIRLLLRNHRGLNQFHQMRLVDWYLYKRANLKISDINIENFYKN